MPLLDHAGVDQRVADARLFGRGARIVAKRLGTQEGIVGDSVQKIVLELVVLEITRTETRALFEHHDEARIQNIALFGSLRRRRSARRAEQWDTGSRMGPSEQYSERLEARERSQAGWDQWHARLGNTRLVLAVAFLMLALAWGRRGTPGQWLLVPSALFAAALLYHQRVQKLR